MAGGKGASKPSGSSLRDMQCQPGMVTLPPQDQAEQEQLRPGGDGEVFATDVGWP